MKATIKATGEIVEIKDLYDDGTALVGNMYIKVMPNVNKKIRYNELRHMLNGKRY